MSDFTIDGSAGNDSFVVRYFRGTIPITGAVTASTYTVQDLAPGARSRIKIKVKATRGAAPGTLRTLRIASTSTGSLAKDVVKARIKVTTP